MKNLKVGQVWVVENEQLEAGTEWVFEIIKKIYYKRITSFIAMKRRIDRIDASQIVIFNTRGRSISLPKESGNFDWEAGWKMTYRLDPKPVYSKSK